MIDESIRKRKGTIKALNDIIQRGYTIKDDCFNCVFHRCEINCCIYCNISANNCRTCNLYRINNAICLLIDNKKSRIPKCTVMDFYKVLLELM